MRQDIAGIWSDIREDETPPQAVQTDRHGSRVAGYSNWPHLAQVCRLERITHRKGETRRETSYAVTGLPEEADAAGLLKLWRSQWGIVNRVHGVRDETMDEDRSQVRTGAAPQVMARLRQEANIAAEMRRCSAKPSLPLTLVEASPQ